MSTPFGIALALALGVGSGPAVVTFKLAFWGALTVALLLVLIVVLVDAWAGGEDQ